MPSLRATPTSIRKRPSASSSTVLPAADLEVDLEPAPAKKAKAKTVAKTVAKTKAMPKPFMCMNIDDIYGEFEG